VARRRRRRANCGREEKPPWSTLAADVLSGGRSDRTQRSVGLLGLWLIGGVPRHKSIDMRTEASGASSSGAWESLSAKESPRGRPGRGCGERSEGPTIRVRQARDRWRRREGDGPFREPPPTMVPLATDEGGIRSREERLALAAQGRLKVICQPLWTTLVATRTGPTRAHRSCGAPVTA
jgi:hypothetical protein